MRKEANIMALMLALLAVGLFSFSAVAADVLIYTQATNQIIEEFRSLSARFGPSLPPNGLRGLANKASPEDGCEAIDPPPVNVTFHDAIPKWVALIVRFNCSFEVKVRNAQEAGYDGVIVYNKGSNELEQMSANDDSDIFIPSVFVGETAGKIIIYDYQYDEGFALVLNDDFPFNINTHLILPFCIVVGLCFIIMLGFMVARCVRERRRILRYRLPRSSLRKLETRKFNKNENYETCAICLDDYEEGDRLRILPCNHAYHIKCIDPWLTKNRRVCPVCKRKVYINGERRSRRNGRRRSSTSDSMSSVDDTTPLINPVENNPNHGTFPGAADQDDEPLGQGVLSDDEILDGSETRPSSGRFNPFDRVPNLPPQLINELYPAIADDQLSSWQRFKRLFHRPPNYSTLNIQDDDVAPLTADDVESSIPVRSSSSAAIPSNSNNILNANLSGSFRDDSQMTSVVQDDDEILDGRRRNSSKRRHEKKNRSAPELQSSEEPTTSSSLIGVAALPNVDFNLLRNPYHDQSNA